jgi:hypothetical protein
VRAIGEELECRVVAERLDGVLALGREPKRLAARRDHAQPGGGREQLRDVAARLDKMLEVVQHKEDPAHAQVFRQRVEHGLARALAHAERLRDGGNHELCLHERRQTDEEDAVREVLDEL